MFVFVEFHFEFDSKKSGAQDKIRDKVWVGTTSDDIFQDIKFIPYSYHNTKSDFMLALETVSKILGNKGHGLSKKTF